jgi:hypothetical protein
MARKTPPIAEQVVAPQLNSNAFLKARLIDFDTGSARLEPQHEAWLRKSMANATRNSMYRIRLVGYASKLGDEGENSNLSYDRIASTLKFLKSVDSKAEDRVETFRANGENAYSAPESDNSADWRAVEAHIFIGSLPPPPQGLTPIPPRAPIPIPGGERFMDWQIASPGGFFVSAIAGGGFNVFFIVNTKTKERRGYIQPVAGVGFSLGLKGLKAIWNVIQQIVTGISYSGMDFTAVTSKLPVTWQEMEDCLVSVGSAGAGVGVGVSAAYVTFTAAGVWQRGASGYPVKLPGGNLFTFKTVGKSWQLGAGGSGVTGPLIKVIG